MRQAWIELFLAPRLQIESYNPRSHDSPGLRGQIVARDGTVLAYSLHGQRYYPYGRMLAQTVGYASERYGASGLESAFSKVLLPSGKSAPLNDRIMELISHKAHTSDVQGGRVVTTLSPVIQTALYDELVKYPRAAGIVINPSNGDILAIASLPSFEPTNIDDHFADLSSDPESSLLNRAVDGLYPPGSTFKILTAATALQDKIITTDTHFSDPGSLAVGNGVIHDDESEATGYQSLAGAFAMSSNVDFAQIGLQLGIQKFYAGMRAFGMDQPIEFPLEVARDRFSAEDAISNSELAQMAFGQADLLVSPMRMALIAATIANGGVEPQPQIVTQTLDAASNSTNYAAKALTRPIDQQTAKALNEMMVGVVTQGTGQAAAIPGIFVAGKTGTATNPHGRAHSWFVAFAPADAPRVAIAVIVENGGYGGAVAAPIAKRVLEAALATTERTK